MRRATLDDLDAVVALTDEEARFHAGPPVFRPYLTDDTRSAVRAEIADALSGDQEAFFIGSVDGTDAGLTRIGPGRGSPLYIPDRGAYIGDTAVVAEHRGRGVGATVVDAALAWARETGYEAVTLHYASANSTSTPLWTGLGFTPWMRHWRRQLDPRIAWATPPSANS